MVSHSPPDTFFNIKAALFQANFIVLVLGVLEAMRVLAALTSFSLQLGTQVVGDRLSNLTTRFEETRAWQRSGTCVFFQEFFHGVGRGSQHSLLIRQSCGLVAYRWSRHDFISVMLDVG